MGTSYFGSFSFGETLQPLYIQTPKVKCKVNVSDLKDKKSIFRDRNTSTNFDLYDLFYLLMIKILKIHYINLKNGFKKKFH